VGHQRGDGGQQARQQLGNHRLAGPPAGVLRIPDATACLWARPGRRSSPPCS
jgi:hypothetical protein